MFKSTLNKGFQMTFPNDLTISVQFGGGNYCSNKGKETSDSVTSSISAEVCVWNEKIDETYLFGDGNLVSGWCDASEVAEYIEKVSKAKDFASLKI